MYLDSIHICVYAYQSLFYHMAKQTDEREREKFDSWRRGTHRQA